MDKLQPYVANLPEKKELMQYFCHLFVEAVHCSSKQLIHLSKINLLVHNDPAQFF